VATTAREDAGAPLVAVNFQRPSTPGSARRFPIVAERRLNGEGELFFRLTGDPAQILRALLNRRSGTDGSNGRRSSIAAPRQRDHYLYTAVKVSEPSEYKRHLRIGIQAPPAHWNTSPTTCRNTSPTTRRNTNLTTRRNTNPTTQWRTTQ
jgi:hypothetical protein